MGWDGAVLGLSGELSELQVLFDVPSQRTLR